MRIKCNEEAWVRIKNNSNTKKTIKLFNKDYNKILETTNFKYPIVKKFNFSDFVTPKIISGGSQKTWVLNNTKIGLNDYLFFNDYHVYSNNGSRNEGFAIPEKNLFVNYRRNGSQLHIDKIENGGISTLFSVFANTITSCVYNSDLEVIYYTDKFDYGNIKIIDVNTFIETTVVFENFGFTNQIEPHLIIYGNNRIIVFAKNNLPFVGYSIYHYDPLDFTPANHGFLANYTTSFPNYIYGEYNNGYFYVSDIDTNNTHVFNFNGTFNSFLTNQETVSFTKLPNENFIVNHSTISFIAPLIYLYDKNNVLLQSQYLDLDFQLTKGGYWIYNNIGYYVIINSDIVNNVSKLYILNSNDLSVFHIEEFNFYVSDLSVLPNDKYIYFTGKFDSNETSNIYWWTFPDDIEIESSMGGINELTNDFLTNPIKINCLKIDTQQNSNQLKNPIRHIYNSLMGKQEKNNYNLLKYHSSFDKQNIVYLNTKNKGINQNTIIDSRNYFEFELEANSEVFINMNFNQAQL